MEGLTPFVTNHNERRNSVLDYYYLQAAAPSPTPSTNCGESLSCGVGLVEGAYCSSTREYVDRRRFNGASAAARMRRAVITAACLDMSVDATCASDAASGGTAVAAEMPAADAGSEKSTPCKHHQLDMLFVIGGFLASLLTEPLSETVANSTSRLSCMRVKTYLHVGPRALLGLGWRRDDSSLRLGLFTRCDAVPARQLMKSTTPTPRPSDGTSRKQHNSTNTARI